MICFKLHIRVRILFLQIQCYKLLCQFGSAPVNGVCTSIALKTYGLAVQIDYKLTIPHNQSCLEATAFVQANQESFGQAVFDSFTKVLSPHTGKCLGCDPWSVRADIGSDIQDPVDVIISSILYTNEQCQLNDIYAKAIDVFSTEIAVELDDMLSINMTIHLDDRTYRDTKKLPIIYRESFESCSPMIRLNDERLCPEIQLKALDLSPSVAKTVTINTETPVEGTNSTLVTVCWEDYISAITSTRSVSSDFAPKPQFKTYTYITSTLSATLALNILLHQ